MNYPKYERWKSEFGNPQLSLWDYINYRGDFELAAAFCSLFWPDFIEVEGHVFLAVNYGRDSFEEWRQTLKGDRRQVESVINHVHLYDLFTNARAEEAELETCEHLGRILSKCWSCALRDKFPDRHFSVIFSTEPDEYGPTLTFFQGY